MIISDRQNELYACGSFNRVAGGGGEQQKNNGTFPFPHSGGVVGGKHHFRLVIHFFSGNVIYEPGQVNLIDFSFFSSFLSFYLPVLLLIDIFIFDPGTISFHFSVKSIN